MNNKGPIGITFISYFQMLGSIVLLMAIKNEQTPAFNMRFGVPFLPELLVKILVIGFGILIAFGYLKQTNWGFWSMLVYSVLFCGMSFLQETQPFIGNAIYSFIVIIYTLRHIHDFNLSFDVLREIKKS